MSDDQSQSSTPQADDIASDFVPQPLADDASPKKKNVLVRIYQSPRSKILLAVFALLMVGVGFVATQKVQTNKSKAFEPGCQNRCLSGWQACIEYARTHNRTSVDAPERAACGSALNNCFAACAAGRQPASSNSSNNSAAAAAAARAAEEARVRAEWQRAYAYAVELKKQQEWRDAAGYAQACNDAASHAPNLTWRSTRGDDDVVQPGNRVIKFQLAPKQDGAIIFIDDKANPWSGSCNDLNAGDKCLVPDGKGLNRRVDGSRITQAQVGVAGMKQTTYAGFEAGHNYKVWLKGMSCAKPSPDSNKLDITVSEATPAAGTGTPSISPTGTNTQQQGHL